MNLLEDEKAQVSTELLIIIGAVVAMAILLVTNLTDTANNANEVMKNKSAVVLEKINKIA